MLAASFHCHGGKAIRDLAVGVHQQHRVRKPPQIVVTLAFGPSQIVQGRLEGFLVAAEAPSVETSIRRC